MIIDDIIEKYNVAGRTRQDRLQLLTAVRCIDIVTTKYVEDGESACCTEAGVAEVNDGIRTAMLGRYLVHAAAGAWGTQWSAHSQTLHFILFILNTQQNKYPKYTRKNKYIHNYIYIHIHNNYIY